MIKIGFTGTRAGMSAVQKEAFADTWNKLAQHSGVSEFHHGDCLGADEEANDVAASVFMQTGGTIVIHPPHISKYRAYCMRKDRIRLTYKQLPGLPYLIRNTHIVHAADWMIGCPGGMEEQLRSGTWATIRYARKNNTNLVIVYPDGTTKMEIAQSVLS